MEASNTPKKPLPGVLATETLRRIAAENEAPTFPKVDSGYKEPPTPAQLRASIDSIAQHVPQGAYAAREVFDELRLLAEALVARIETLSMALMPFATHGLMMANMQMVLTGAGRVDEPAGGTWINGVHQAQMQSNATIFYVAADAIGRAAVEDRVMSIFQKMQQATAAAAERDAHVADKHLEGPIGGPVSGQIH